MKTIRLLFLLMLMSVLNVQGQELTISDIFNSGCLARARNNEASQDVKTIVLKKEGSTLQMELHNYISSCGTLDFQVLTTICEGVPSTLSVIVNPVIEDEMDCECPYNVSFSINGLETNSFRLKCWFYDGLVELEEGKTLELIEGEEQWAHEYVPFVEEGKVWMCKSVGAGNTNLNDIDCIFKMSGDTLIGSQNYKKVFCEYAKNYGDSAQHYYCAVREEDSRVYVIESENTEEKQFYDFSLPRDTLFFSYSEDEYARLCGYRLLGYPKDQLSFDIIKVVNGKIDRKTGVYSWWEGVGVTDGNPFEFFLEQETQKLSPKVFVVSCLKDGEYIYKLKWTAQPTQGGTYGNASVQNPVDMTFKIVNPRFKDNDLTTGWSGTGFNNPSYGEWAPKENAECYNKTYDIYQTINELPDGIYAVGMRGFYQAGDPQTAYNHYKANDEASHYAKLYARSADCLRENSIVSIFEGSRTEPLADSGEKSITDEETGQTYWVPATMSMGERYMHELCQYGNRQLVMVDYSSMIIGVKKEKTVDGDWSLFDDFSLTYYGNGPEAYQMYLDDARKEYDSVMIPEGTLYTPLYLEELHKYRTATSSTDVFMQLDYIQLAYDNLQTNISLWKVWKNTISRGGGIAKAPCFAENEQAQQVIQYCDVEAIEIEAARSLTNEQLEEEISKAEAMINALYSQDCYAGKMLKEGKQWVYTRIHDSVATKVTYTINGEMQIEGRNYKKLYYQEGDGAPVFNRALREEGSTVYIYRDNKESRYIEYNPLYYPDGFKEYIELLSGGVITESIDYVSVNGRVFIRHSYKYNDGSTEMAVEGVGYENKGILDMSYSMLGNDYLRFEACYEDGKCIFTKDDFRKPGIHTSIKSATTKQHQGPNTLFDLQGRRLSAEPKHGVYIRKGKKVVK